MKLLIGFDGSEGAEDAVALARWLAGADGEALLVNVLPHPGPLPVPYSILDQEESHWAQELFQGPAAALAPLRVRWQSFVGGSPSQILTDLAASERCDLIVVGSPHRGAVGRAVLGSVAQGVLHGAPAPVAVAPRGFASQRRDRVGRIAVACDGSPESAVALERAAALARGHGASLELLTVVTAAPPAPSLLGFRLDPQQPPGEVIAAGLAAVGEGVAAKGRELHAGSVPSGLVAACDGVDLLVAGSRGYGMVGRVMVGSVSTALISSAPCPVLVVPRPK